MDKNQKLLSDDQLIFLAKQNIIDYNKNIAKELTYKQIADWTKQNDQILINLKKEPILCGDYINPVQVINEEYSKLQKICEEKTQRKLKTIPTLLFIDDKIMAHASYNFFLPTIALNLNKFQYLTYPESDTSKESLIHELTHAIHLQNNKELLNNTLNQLPDPNNSKNNKQSYNLKESFPEGFALYIGGFSKKIHTEVIRLTKQIKHLETKSNKKSDLVVIRYIKNELNHPYYFGSFIFEEIKRLKGNKSAIDHAFKYSGFTPEDMQTDYEKFCKEKNKKPVPYLQLIKNYKEKLSDINLKTTN